jgi:hypothetical protein
MTKKDFDAFVKSQATQSGTEQVDWAKERDEWIGYLNRLYALIESLLESYRSAGEVQFEYRQISLNEPNIGSYFAKQMVLKFGRQEITFTPIGTLLIGTKGRVDVVGPAGGARLLLLNKKATSASSLIRVTVSVGGKSHPPEPHPPESQPTEPIEWTWKIASPPPQLKFIELTEETFFDMILAVVNA